MSNKNNLLSPLPAVPARSNYTDFTDLQAIKKQGGKDQEAALEKVAQQFESIMLHTMLKTMREANQVFNEDSMFNSSEMQFHQDMFDHQLSLSLSTGKGLGLADVLKRQLSAQFSTVDAQSKLNADEKGFLQHPFQAIDANRIETAPKKSETVPKKIDSVEKKVDSGSPEKFVASVMPMAQAAAEKLGVDSRLLVAQAALETGWGQHILTHQNGRSSNNLFNIKADGRWTADKVPVTTVEYSDGVAYQDKASFRAYKTPEHSFTDYAEFVTSGSRYQEALNKAHDPYQYLHALQRAGYATDPEYADKVWKVYQSDAVQSLDITPISTLPIARAE